MARIKIEDLNSIFNLLEDLADEEKKRLDLYIETMGYDENEPVIIKSEAKIKELRAKAEKIAEIMDLLIDEEEEGGAKSGL